MKSKHKTSF